METAEGRRYVLKVAPAASDLARLDSEARLMTSLADEGWPVPQPRRVSEGRGLGRFVAQADQRPEGGWARLMTWIEGTPWAEVADTGAGFGRRLGRFLARLDRALAELEAPELDRPHEWDVLRVEEKLPALDAIDDAARRERVGTWVREFARERAPLLRQRPRALLHNDANDHNLLLAPDAKGILHIAGLIDFGDALWSARVAEPAIAAAYLALRSESPVDAARELLEGYEEEWPLARSERVHFVACLRARVCQSVLTSADRRRTRTDAYVDVHTQQAWALLDRWDADGWDALALELSKP